jgi:hypothetical protein
MRAELLSYVSSFMLYSALIRYLEHWSLLGTNRAIAESW